MANVTPPKWFGGNFETLARRVKPIIHLIKLNEPVAPSDIDALVGGAYSAKYITFLRLLGFEFSTQKDGRKVASYTVVAEPAHAEDIRNVAPKQPKVKAPKAPKVPKAKTVKAPVAAKAAKAPAKKAAATKKGGNAANLAKLKAVGQKFQKPADEVEATFGTTGEVSAAVDAGWDSLEGVDLAKLI